MKHEVLAQQLNANEDEAKVVLIAFATEDFVSKGESIFTLETSKTTHDIESEFSGYIKYLVNKGDDVKVGDVVALIFDNIDELRSETGAKINKSNTKGLEDAKITKKAAALLSKYNINVSELNVAGIVRESDILNYVEMRGNSNVLNNENSRKIDKFQAGMIKTLEISKASTIPAYISGKVKVSDNFCKLGISALAKFLQTNSKKFKWINEYISDGVIRTHKEFNCGLTLSKDERLNILSICIEDSTSIEQVEAHRLDLTLDYFRDAVQEKNKVEPTACLSWLAMKYESFQIPVLFPKTSIIVGAALCQLEDSNILSLTLAYDHKLVSGYEVSKLLDALLNQVEEF